MLHRKTQRGFRLDEVRRGCTRRISGPFDGDEVGMGQAGREQRFDLKESERVLDGKMGGKRS